jgi:hypothetical protein
MPKSSYFGIGKITCSSERSTRRPSLRSTPLRASRRMRNARPHGSRRRTGQRKRAAGRAPPHHEGVGDPRVNAKVTSFVYIPPTISPAFCGLIVGRAYHVAFQDSGLGCAVDRCRRVRARRILDQLAPLHRDRRASVQITSLAWQAQLQVSFTSDPSTATVRVQLSESAGAADFAVVDDVDSAEDGAKRFTARDAAALVVGASGIPSRLAAASL